MKAYIDGIEIEIEKKKIKNMHLYVKPEGRVLLTAPKRISDREIEGFVTAKADWIRKNLEKMASVPIKQNPEYVDGELISVWGNYYTLRVLEGTSYSLRLECADGTDTDGTESAESADGADTENAGGENIGTAILTVRSGCTAEQKEHFILEWYREQLAERVNILLPKWEAYTGLKCSSWQSKNMKSRWGTCNTSTKKIWLNVQLAKYPTECLDYVILHELAHTRVANHGADFKAVLNRFMPDWKEHRRRLKTL